MNYFGAQIGTAIGLVLAAIEIVVFVVLAIWMVISAGDQNTASVLTTEHANAPGFEGMAGVFGASVFAFLAFIGFEAAAPLAAETKNPRRNVPRAIIGSALIVGIFYLFTTYAVDVYFGPSKFADFLGYENGNGWITITKDLWGAGWIILLITILNSCLACANGGAMAGTRSIWAMAHHRVLPGVLARTHPRWRSPVVAMYVFFGLAALSSFTAAAVWGPVLAFFVLGQMLAVAVLPIYIAAALACPVYYYRYRRTETNVFLHIVIPVAAAVFLVPPVPRRRRNRGLRLHRTPHLAAEPGRARRHRLVRDRHRRCRLPPQAPPRGPRAPCPAKTQTWSWHPDVGGPIFRHGRPRCPRC